MDNSSEQFWGLSAQLKAEEEQTQSMSATEVLRRMESAKLNFVLRVRSAIAAQLLNSGLIDARTVMSQNFTYDTKGAATKRTGIVSSQPTTPAPAQPATGNTFGEYLESLKNSLGNTPTEEPFWGMDPFAPITLDPPECEHRWQHYVGLTEVYDFCTKCDKKRQSE